MTMNFHRGIHIPAIIKISHNLNIHHACTQLQVNVNVYIMYKVYTQLLLLGLYHSSMPAYIWDPAFLCGLCTAASQFNLFGMTSYPSNQ